MSNRLVKKQPEPEEHYGITFYSNAGGIFIVCGIGFFLLTLYIGTLPQDYEKYNIPLFFFVMYAISGFFTTLGAVLFLLCKRSKRFQKWADRDMEKTLHKLFMKEFQRYEKKTRNK